MYYISKVLQQWTYPSHDCTAHRMAEQLISETVRLVQPSGGESYQKLWGILLRRVRVWPQLADERFEISTQCLNGEVGFIEDLIVEIYFSVDVTSFACNGIYASYSRKHDTYHALESQKPEHSMLSFVHWHQAHHAMMPRVLRSDSTIQSQTQLAASPTWTLALWQGKRMKGQNILPHGDK